MHHEEHLVGLVFEVGLAHAVGAEGPPDEAPVRLVDLPQRPAALFDARLVGAERDDISRAQQ